MKIAIVFPGIGYHIDKPLLYYARRLAAEAGYDVHTISYPETFSKTKLRGDDAALEAAVRSMLDEVKRQLKREELAAADDVIMIGKSIGTVYAAAVSAEWRPDARHIVFTPLVQTFSMMSEGSGIVFHGTADPWADTETIERECHRLLLPLYITGDANHSLETGHAARDIGILTKTMQVVETYLHADAPAT